MTSVDGRFQDTFKDPNSIPVFNGKTELDFTNFTDLPEIDKAIKEGRIDEMIRLYADWVRRQGYGAVVREGIARLAEYLNVKLNNIEDKNSNIYVEYLEIQKELQKIKEDFNQVINAQTIDGEVKLARKSELYNYTYPSLKARLDVLEGRCYTSVIAQSVHTTREFWTNSLSRLYSLNIIKKNVEEILQENPIIVSEIGKGRRFEFVKVGVI